MSRVITRQALGISLLVLAIAGCGDPNAQSGFDANSGHPAQWLLSAHKTAALNNVDACTQCHGAELDGGISVVSCAACHVMGIPDTPATPLALVCGYCHGDPPDGTESPNTAGKHAKHVSLAVVDCSACHQGASDGAPGHYDENVVVAFDLPTYEAKSATVDKPTVFTVADNTCSKVSCHGGQTTPSWFTGVIDVNTQCGSCHITGVTEYNSASSGKHDLHVNTKNKACTACHDTIKLRTTHFISLNTPELNRLPAGPAARYSIRDAVNYRYTDDFKCNPEAGGLTGCHDDGKSPWF